MRTALNLLSPGKRQALRTVLALTTIQTSGLLIAFVAMSLAGLLFSLRLTLASTSRGLHDQSSAALDEYDSATKQIRDINGFVRRTQEIQDSFIDWSAVLENIGQTAPDGIKFEGLTVDTDLTVSIIGTALTRDDVLEMERRLKANPYFRDVSSPLSNILQRENLRFEFNLTYEPNPEP
ncbi:MAG: PilN domain-containing protein [bacterium]